MAYEKFEGKELILRDELAIERTKLAEERTSLAYIRTGISLMMGGLFFIGYFKEGTFSYIGYATVGMSLMFLIYGFYHHKKTIRLIDKLTFGALKLERHTAK